MDDNLKNRQSRARQKNSEASHLVGDCENLMPYAWNNPMVVDEHKCSKVLREMDRAEKLRMAPESSQKKA